MGCLGSIFKKIIILALIIAFFAFGGYGFVKQKINEYQNPSRADFVKSEKNYGDFSKTPSDYQLSRCFSFFGYKKINAKYLPTNQKITILDLKNNEKITPQQFITSEIDEKILDILSKTKDSVITLENFKITEKNKWQAVNKAIPYIKFEASVKNIPFKNITGIIGAYESQNSKKPSTKLIITITDTKAYNPTIVKDFVQSIKFENEKN